MTRIRSSLLLHKPVFFYHSNTVPANITLPSLPSTGKQARVPVSADLRISHVLHRDFSAFRFHGSSETPADQEVRIPALLHIRLFTYR
jgi:hypothetical protein